MSFARPDLDAIAALVRSVAATEIMPRFRKLGAGDIQEKSGPTDLVTIADEAAEARLAEALARLHPGCHIVGEEAATRDPTRLEALATAPLAFVVDPIDGTFNYASGLPLFGVIVAVLAHGRTIGAIIHDPVGDDTAWAMRGQGAWLEAPNRTPTRLHVAPPAPASKMSGSVSWRYMPEPRRSQVCANLPRLGGAWDYRCAAHQYRLLAAGHCHFSVYNRLLPWDHAAGVLLHQEAGGHVAMLDGRPYDPARIEGGMIAAPDPASWTDLRDALFEA